MRREGVKRQLTVRVSAAAVELSKRRMSEASIPSTADFLTMKPYSPPTWAAHLRPIPSHSFSLAHLPTPIHRWNLPNLPNGTELWIKRDDLTYMEVSGNKLRKLEFLMADAVEQHADSVITIGGIQSNHCRATAVVSNYLNLRPYLILRTSKVPSLLHNLICYIYMLFLSHRLHPSQLLVDDDPGLVGNLLVGAHVNLISKEDYVSIGSGALADVLKERLENEGRKPYVIPVGGSNSLGTWGYIEAAREIEQQLNSRPDGLKFDDIIVACGSGGTIAGIGLGSWLGLLKAKVHAFSVCGDPDRFYDFAQGLLDGLQAGINSRDIVNIHNAKGLGYAMNTSEELQFLKEVADATGVILDPVYSGKAAYGLMQEMAKDPKKWEGRKILFIHTGGRYDKADQIAPVVGNWSRMDVESVPRKDGDGKIF